MPLNCALVTWDDMITGFCHSSSWRQGVAFGWIFGLLGVPEWLFWEGFSRLKVLVKMPCWILNEPVKSLAFCDGRSFDRFWAICAPKWLRCPPTSVKVNTKEWCLSNTWCVKGVYVKPSRVLWRMNWWSWRNIWQWKSTSCGKNPRKDWMKLHQLCSSKCRRLFKSSLMPWSPRTRWQGEGGPVAEHNAYSD